jgi:hypothetical protein
MHFRRLPRHRLRFRGSGCARPNCAPSSLALEIRGIPEIFFDDALTRLAASRAPIFATQPPGDGTLVTAQYLIGNERSLLDSRSHDPANYGSLPKTEFFNGILDLHIPMERRRGPLWVTVRRTRLEHIFSGMSPIAAGSEPCRHLRSTAQAAPRVHPSLLEGAREEEGIESGPRPRCRLILQRTAAEQAKARLL